MNYGKQISLPRSTPVTDSDSAIGEDYDEDSRSHKRAGLGKDKMNRNLSEKKRRDQFNMLVNELCTMVSTSNKKMDKSTVLNLTIAFLRKNQETTDQAQVHEIKEDWKPSFLTNDEFMHLMLEALDSFLLVFTQQGVILYASESVTSLLGHLPSDMVNKSIYDFVSKHETSHIHNILYNYRVNSGTTSGGENQLVFDCNFRCGSVNPHESPNYEPVTIQGSFKQVNRNADEEAAAMLGPSNKEQVCFCSTVRLQSSQLVREMSIVDDNKEFTSRHSLEWKFLFLDHRAPPIIGYLPFEVLGTSGYDYYHPDDLAGVTVSHEQLMKTGEGVSCYYRFLTKGQQWIWLKTRYFITYHQWNSKPEFINCTNTVVSYADVRAQKRKEMGIYEDDSSQPDKELPSSFHKMSGSPSVGLVTSCGRMNPACPSSPLKESEGAPGCTLSDKESKDISTHPTSTSHSKSRTVSKQLQQYLQRNLLQQQQQKQQQQQQQQHHQLQQQQQQASSSPLSHQSPGESPAQFSNVSLQQLLYQRQQRKQETQYARILPRTTATAVMDQQSAATRLVMSQAVSSPNTVSVIATCNPTPLTVAPQGGLVSQNMNMATNVYMTPVQRQLHEQLQRKAQQVQDAILRQQEELRIITQQLTFAQGAGMSVMSSNADDLVEMMGGEQAVMVSASSTPSLMAQPDPSQVVNLGTQTMMVNQSPQVLPFSMLSPDAEIYLSLTDTADSPQNKHN